MRNKISILCLVLILPVIAFGQSDSYSERMIEKIDSVANAYKIEKTKIYFNKISSYSDVTATKDYCVAKADSFHFDRMFLVVNNKYFNIEKLLYFERENDYLEFYFQAY